MNDLNPFHQYVERSDQSTFPFRHLPDQPQTRLASAIVHNPGSPGFVRMFMILVQGRLDFTVDAIGAAHSPQNHGIVVYTRNSGEKGIPSEDHDKHVGGKIPGVVPCSNPCLPINTVYGVHVYRERIPRLNQKVPEDRPKSLHTRSIREPTDTEP